MTSPLGRVLAKSICIGFLATNGAGCSKAPEPSSPPPADVDADSTIERIRREQARSKVAVEQEVRRSLREDRADAGLVPAPPRAPEGLTQLDQADGGIQGEGADSVSGKLETSAPNQLIVRDHTGFAYRLKTDERTRVMLNGQPAKLDQFKQGTEVRATYVFDNGTRVATQVEVVQPR